MGRGCDEMLQVAAFIRLPCHVKQITLFCLCICLFTKEWWCWWHWWQYQNANQNNRVLVKFFGKGWCHWKCKSKPHLIMAGFWCCGEDGSHQEGFWQLCGDPPHLQVGIHFTKIYKRCFTSSNYFDQKHKRNTYFTQSVNSSQLTRPSNKGFHSKNAFASIYDVERGSKCNSFSIFSEEFVTMRHPRK